METSMLVSIKTILPVPLQQFTIVSINITNRHLFIILNLEVLSLNPCLKSYCGFKNHTV